MTLRGAIVSAAHLVILTCQGIIQTIATGANCVHQGVALSIYAQVTPDIVLDKEYHQNIISALCDIDLAPFTNECESCRLSIHTTQHKFFVFLTTFGRSP
jgi:hypothetical protein